MTPPASPPAPSPGAPAAPAPDPFSGPESQPVIPASLMPAVDRSNPVAVAVDQARRRGERVEIVPARSETETTWANPDGSLTTAVAAGPVRVMQGERFVDVDPTLTLSAGVVAPKASKGSVRFSAGGAAGAELASIASESSRLALRWPGSLPTPTLDGATATYHDVAPNQDLVVRATTTGFETFVVLRSAPTEQPVIRIPPALQNLSVSQLPGGAIRVADPSGKREIQVPSLVMFSAARDARADEPTQVRRVDAAVEQGAAGPELVLRPDMGFLADPTTQYPVTIDPASTLTANLSNYVDSAWPGENYDGSQDLKVGTWNNGAQITRSFIRFNMAPIKGTQVSFAQLNIYEWWAYSCTDAPMWIDGVPTGAFNPGSTWNNQPAVDGRHWYNWSFSGGYSGCPGTAGWKYLDITGLAQQWAGNGNNGYDALALLAPNEFDNYQWKKFYSVNTATPPAVYVTYSSSLPGTPQNVQAAAGNGQATVSWSPPSNPGSPPLSSYNVYTSQWNGTSCSVVRTDSVCGTCTSKVLTGLTNGGVYAATVQSVSSAGGGGYAVSNVFVPAAPPSASQNLVAHGGNASASLRWAPPASNGGTTLDYSTVGFYDITTSPAVLQYAFNVAGGATATPYPVAGAPAVANNRIYQFAVWPHNGPGGYGPGSVSNAFVPGPVDALAKAGDRDYFTYDSYPLNDRLTARVNVGTGNLAISQTDLSVPMVGGGAPLTRTYNSLSVEPGAVVD